MQFVMISRRQVEQFTPADFAPHLRAEWDHGCELYQQGIVRQIWHRADAAGGACMILEAESLEAAQAAVGDLPLVKLGMLEIVSLIPLKPYAGFAPHSQHT